MISYILMKLKIYRSMMPVMVIMGIMTLIFIYVFGVGFSQPYIPKVIVVDEDGSETSGMIVASLKADKSYAFSEEVFDSAKTLLEKGSVIGIVHINSGFEAALEAGKSEIIFYKSGASIEQVVLSQKLGTLVEAVLTDKKFSKGLSDWLVTKDISIPSEGLYRALTQTKRDYATYEITADFYKAEGVDYNPLKNNFNGFLLFFSMFIIMFGIGTIVEEKELQVWHRQVVSPLPSWLMMTGNLISNFIVGMIQLVAVVLVSKVLFKIDWGGSTLAMLCVLGAYVIAGTAMGLFISGFVKTQQQLSAALPTVIVATSMLGGCMWPLEMIQNQFLRNFANLLPQRWGMAGLSKVVIYNGGLVDVLQPIFFLLIIASVFLIACVIPRKKA